MDLKKKKILDRRSAFLLDPHEEDGELYVSAHMLLYLGTSHNLSGNEISVFIAIARHLLQFDSQAYTLSEMAEVVNLNISTVRSCLAKLESKEMIVKWIPEGSNDRTYHYDFSPEFYFLMNEVY